MRSPAEAGELVAGRYRIGDPLGRGGMGAVYRATDEALGREVAIKLLLPTREGLEAEARFKREARAAAMISDPHVVGTHDFGPHRDGFYLAMELVEGRTVAVELRLRGPLEAERAVDIIRQAAAGLAAAHQHGLVHRDIKPGNLMITADGLVKVADFGIVRILDDTTTTLTAAGQVVGTSHYLAPERALGKPAGAASDVYALGCVLYQLVTGHPPFQAEDPASIMYQHVQTWPTRPSELRPKLAGEFEALLFWMLAKDPSDRPTAAQVAAGEAPPALAPTDVMTALPVRRRPSRTVLVGAAAALAIVAASAIGILIDANSVKLPATSDLQPSVPAVSTPAPTRLPTVAATKTSGPATAGSTGRNSGSGKSTAPIRAGASTGPGTGTSAKPATAIPSVPNPSKGKKTQKTPNPNKTKRPGKPD